LASQIPHALLPALVPKFPTIFDSPSAILASNLSFYFRDGTLHGIGGNASFYDNLAVLFRDNRALALDFLNRFLFPVAAGSIPDAVQRLAFVYSEGDSAFSSPPMWTSLTGLFEFLGPKIDTIEVKGVRRPNSADGDAGTPRRWVMRNLL